MALEFNSDDVIQTSKVASGMGDFFPESGMRASEVRRIQANYAQNIAPLQDRLMNLDNNIMRLQTQDLAYKNAQLEFERRQEQQRLQRDFNDPALYEQIDAVLSSEAPPLEQREQIQEIARQNPQALLNVPSFQQVYNTAIDQTRTRAEQEAKTPKLEEGVSTLANRLLQVPSTKANVAGGKLLRGEMTFDEGIAVLGELQKETKEAAQREKLSAEKEEVLKEDISLVQGAKVNDASFQDYLETAPDEVRDAYDNLETAEQRTLFIIENQPPIRFNSVYRNRLIRRLAKRTNRTQEEVRKAYPRTDPKSDVKLLEDLKDAVDFARADSVGGDFDDPLLDLEDTREERDIRGAIAIPPSGD